MAIAARVEERAAKRFANLAVSCGSAGIAGRQDGAGAGDSLESALFLLGQETVSSAFHSTLFLSGANSSFETSG
jgi:hypothetical protein